MDRLATLVSFVRVCETGNFSSAARDLGLTQPAVSQHVRTLESHLGVRLFDRTTRQVSLTELGTRYLDHARAVLERLDEADHEIGAFKTALSGRLVVGASVGFGASILAPYLIDFKQVYPDIFVDVTLTDRFVDVIGERLDVAIRMGTITDGRLIARRIGQVERCLAATGVYLDRRGRPQHPSDLSKHDYLLHAQIVNGERISLRSMDNEIVEARPRPVFRSDNSSLLTEGILANLGIGLIHKPLLTPLIASGRLEHVLPRWEYEPQDVHALYPSNRYVPMKVRAFVDGLIIHMRRLGVLTDA